MSELPHHSAEELAANESFRGWVLYDDPSDGAFWNDWLRQNPDKSELVEQATGLVLGFDKIFDQVSDADLQAELDRLDEALAHEASEKQPEKRLFRITYLVASLVFLILSGWWWANRMSSSSGVLLASGTDEPEYLAADTPSFVYLTDGSTAVLQPGSRLRCAAGFGDSVRVVFLTGEAFFEVVKDPARPFMVYTGSLVTKVLGTSFTVSAIEKSKNVKVAVKTGRVSVFPIAKVGIPLKEEPKEGMILTSNQQLVYATDGSRATRSLVDVPEIIEVGVSGRTFNFRHRPIADVFEALSDAYAVEILFDREAMKTCYLTAEFDEEPLFEKLELICRTIGARFEQLDGAIIVNSAGCD